MNRELRHTILDLVLDCPKRASVEFDQYDRGHISVTTWKKSGKIDDLLNSWNYSSEQDFFEDVKRKLK